MRTMLKGKIHRARVTEVNIDYEGSITLDRLLMEAADILLYERVHVVDVNNGSRLETYVIEGGPGSGVVCVNGAAARLVDKGDVVIILSYQTVPDAEARSVSPRVVHVDRNNRLVEVREEAAALRI